MEAIPCSLILVSPDWGEASEILAPGGHLDPYWMTSGPHASVSEVAGAEMGLASMPVIL